MRKRMECDMTHEQLTLKPAQGQLVAACNWVQQLQQMTWSTSSRCQGRAPEDSLQELCLCFRSA